MAKNKVYIRGNDRNFALAINDQVVRKVKYLEFRCGIDEPATVTAEFYVDDVQIETEEGVMK